MSVNYTAYAVIGIKVDSSKFTTLEKKRGCKCDVKNIEKMQFCSNCGAKVFTIEKTPLPQFDEDSANLQQFPCGQSFCDYPIIYTDSGYDGKAYLAAAFVKDGQYGEPGDGRMQMPKDIEKMKEKMKNALGPIGFWDEKKFGIWAVLRVS